MNKICYIGDLVKVHDPTYFNFFNKISSIGRNKKRTDRYYQCLFYINNELSLNGFYNAIEKVEI